MTTNPDTGWRERLKEVAESARIGLTVDLAIMAYFRDADDPEFNAEGIRPAWPRFAASVTSALAEIDTLTQALEVATNQLSSQAKIEADARVYNWGERYGFEQGKLQWAWRCGERSDAGELEWAICDALQMGNVRAWPGDGVSCAAQIVTKQMQRAEKAEAALEAAKAGLEEIKAMGLGRRGYRPADVAATALAAVNAALGGTKNG